ncbi:MAG TPA: L-histidine N(alpha)-methyltransferase, partial [Bryobacteraceae bacterium]|nr:L-histidine N(alpha)-methyltransferase [Bryobacteraceae bacterium]
GLTRPGQKELPSVYLYDALGSALFEAITLLPEYGLTRADERILRRYAATIVERLPVPLVVTELGSGSGRKTRWLLEALARGGPVTYYPIDISAAALARCKFELSGIGPIGVVGLEQSYLDGLAEVAVRRTGGEALLVLFLGSTIGNFERGAGEDFLRAIRASLSPGDGLLLGTDLVKPPARLIAAYDDPTGVTAAFNLNLLARINRELAGNFSLRQFAHEARYDERRHRIEMHLVSTRHQTVSIPGAGITATFEKGESIWTEACHKFQLEELEGIAERTGFRSRAQWVDPQWPFAESLWIAR